MADFYSNPIRLDFLRAPKYLTHKWIKLDTITLLWDKIFSNLQNLIADYSITVVSNMILTAAFLVYIIAIAITAPSIFLK